MILKKCILTANDCYKKGAKMDDGRPKGIVVHSTGAPNSSLKRYVQPLTTDKDYETIIADIGVNTNRNHWNQSKEAMGRKVCVHAFIGKNANGVVETYQTLPFDVCCWGIVSGSKGSYNYNPQARIQFEICEDNLNNRDYFNKAMREAQEFCAYLCKTYGFGVDKISSHKESHYEGYGDLHEDPHHWLRKFGKDMEWFRDEVSKILTSGSITEANKPISTANNNCSEYLVYEYLRENTDLNNSVICGIMANLRAESGFISTNLQNSYESKLGYSDLEYTAAVDNGSYNDFVGDKAGYGLAQWTYWSRKQKLLDYAKSKNTSIGDYKMQLDFLISELKEYKDLWNYFTTCANDLDAAYGCGFTFCYDFERPANRENNSKSRGEKAKEYFNKYNKPNTVVEKPVEETIKPSTGNLTYETIHINSTYDFVGGLQYRSSRAETGSEAKPCRVKVTNKAPESWAHPVHVRSINESGAFIKGVYGWVDVNTIKCESHTAIEPYKVKVTADALNFRKGPGTDYAVVGTIRDKGVYTIVDVVDGWGLLKSYSLTRGGWINLFYTKKL